MYLVLADDTLVVVCRQGDLSYPLGVNVVLPTAEDVHEPVGSIAAEETLLIVIKGNALPDGCLLDSLSLLLLSSLSHPVRVQLGSETNELRYLIGSRLGLEHTDDLLVQSARNARAGRRGVLGEVAGVEPFGHVGRDVPKEVLRDDLIAQAVGVREQELGSVSILGFNVVVVELVHERLAEVQDAHPEVNGFVKLHDRPLHVCRHQVLREDGHGFEAGLPG